MGDAEFTPLDGSIRILFLCTGNSCRSQMAEAIVRHLGADRFVARSAGSEPAGFVHPLAVAALQHLGIPLRTDAASKSWDLLRDEHFDALITLCDAAAGQACPITPRLATTAHWPLTDPATHPGSEEDRLALAVRVAERLRLKITGLTELDWSQPRALIEARLSALGAI